MENIYLVSLGSVLGAIFGSFFNAIAIRTVEGRPWWGRERSRCPICDHELSSLDLIPLVSWLALKGRCRYCKGPISFRYPLVELLFVLWTGAALIRWGATFGGVGAVLGGWLMMLNAMTDLDSGYVYDKLAATIGIVGIAIRVFGGLPAILDGVYGALAGGGVIAAIIVISRGGMGWGDATLMAGAGALLGWKTAFLASYLGFMVGGTVALAMIAMKKAGRKDSVPLAPFLAAGVMIALIWGPNILGFWYYAPGWPWI
nr:prepilin peptidase [uncultured Dethiosulfovibrio sp.]